MKKRTVWIVLPLLMIVCAVIFWEPVLDALPIDQSGWRESGGKQFYHDAKGDPVTGWQALDGNRYYLNPADDGAMLTGWLELDGERYYLGSGGALVTGWADLDSGRYYFGEDGAMASGWIEADGQRYYLDAEGHPGTGWLETEAERYYLQPDGAVTTGWLELDGSRYYLDESGIMATGWVTVGNEIYYLREDGTACSGWLEVGEDRCYLEETGKLHTGWLELDGERYYLDEAGSMVTGWLEADGQRYYLNADGTMFTGWLVIDGCEYYLQGDGTAARGRVVIDEKTYYFTSAGASILLVNLWNPLPEDYDVNLVYSASGALVADYCDEALRQMLSDCRAAGFSPSVCSSYRSISTQRYLFNRKVGQWQNKGYNYEDAYAHAMQIVAVPGTSEHHTGLAVDIVDANFGILDERQAERPTQKWLMENCWKYGFILRYPVGSTEITGIIYEPWHYRYVGLELAAELHELDMCLEEYLDMLTADGTTCGGTAEDVDETFP